MELQVTSKLLRFECQSEKGRITGMVADALPVAGQAIFRNAHGVLSLCLKAPLICKGGLSDEGARMGLLIS